MRRMIVIAALGACGGFCLASATALGYAKLNAWRDFGEKFQLGYVVGYLDAVTLAKRHDRRAFVPAVNKPQYERWRDMVNAFYEDPANSNRPLPDAMAAAGARLQEELLQSYRQQQDREWTAKLAASPVPSPSASPRTDARGTP